MSIFIDKKQVLNRLPRRRTAHVVAIAVSSMLVLPHVSAGEIDSGNPDLKLRWDNTVKYSAGARVKGQSATLLADSNLDDGDRNFGKGLIQNRLDLLSEFDASYNNFGARISGTAWYDTAYTGNTDNHSPLTYNAISVSNDRFPEATRKLHGKKAELLDAFLFVKGDLGDMPATLRVGRHALLYGETLFFGSNGIAKAQQPIDIVKALSVPGTQVKELIRPVGQISTQVQLRPNVTIGGYYQYRWEASVLPGVGSYFSDIDFLAAGSERILTGPTSAFRRTADLRPKNSGQGGMQLRWTPEGSGLDLGFYAARYHDKTPQSISNPLAGTYLLAYHENVKTFGASFSTTFGPANVAGEVSVRHNASLSAAGSSDLFGLVPVAFGGPRAPANNTDNPSYPVGRTAHANVSVLYQLPVLPFARESSLVAEFAWNRTTSITSNPAALDPKATRDAFGMQLQYSPTYRQVVPGIDVSVPIGLSYFPKGKSSAVTAFGPDKGGAMTVGASAVYLAVWNIGMNLTHYYGAEAPSSTQVGTRQVFTYGQTLKDRDFVSLSISRTF